MKGTKKLILAAVVVLMLISQIPLTTANSYPYSVITVGNSTKSVDSTSAMVCECVMLSGRHSVDIDGIIESYNWTENGKTIGKSREVTLCIKDTTTRIITLEVTDDEKGTGKSEIVIYADSNKEPKIKDMDTNIGNDDLRVYSGQQFEVSAHIDTDDKIEVIWDYDERVLQQVGKNKIYRNKYSAEFAVLKDVVNGNSKIKISAVDICGQKDEKEISIEVFSSRKLEIGKINIPDIKEGDRFSVSANVDTEEELKFFWTLTDLSRNNSVVGTSSKETPRFRLSDEGFYEIKLTIINARGDSLSDFETFEVENTQDDLPVADASRTEKVAILHIPLTLDGSKSYDDSGITHYDWFVYNKASKEYERVCDDNQPLCNHTFHQEGEHKVRLVVRDNKEPMPHQKDEYDFVIRVLTMSTPVPASTKTQLAHTPQSQSTPRYSYSHSPQNQYIPVSKTPGMGIGLAILALIIAIIIARKGGNKF